MHRIWDSVVIGAGPAGSLAAYQAARLGASVLLVDQSDFPRAKVCGGCVNAAAMAGLERVGLGKLLGRLGAAVLEQMQLRAGRLRVTLALPPGASVSRAALDEALMQEAVRAGASFLPRTQATVESRCPDDVRCVRLRGASMETQVSARIVIVADGLAGRALSGVEGFQVQVAPRPRVGVGAIVDMHPETQLPDRTVVMASAKGGYVGIVRVERQQLAVAAALDPQDIQHAGGAGKQIQQILNAAKTSVAGLDAVHFRGTPLLTQRRTRVAAHRIFVAGDSAGYVEPFTGEGITWAIQAGVAAGALAAKAARSWEPSFVQQWTAHYRAQFGSRQWRCRWITQGLRSPALTGSVLSALSRFPRLMYPLVRSVCGAAASGWQ